MFTTVVRQNWLFFGDQSEKTEFYYKDEIEGWIDEGHLWRFTTAWSRDQERKSTFNTDSRSMVQRCGNGLSAVRISTSAATSNTWPRTFTVR